MLDDDGRALLFSPSELRRGRAEPIARMILHPRRVLGLGDGGATADPVRREMTTFHG